MTKLVEFNGIEIRPDKVDWIGKVISEGEPASRGRFTYQLAGKQFEVRGTAEESAEEMRERLRALVAAAS